MTAADLNLVPDVSLAKAPDDTPIRFDLKPNQNPYLYWVGPRGVLYCYTPHRDTMGRCWVWTYKPVGKGSRSGNPHRWKMIDLERISDPRTAKRAALLRLREAKREL